MVAVILAEDDNFFSEVSKRARLHRYSVIRYRDPVKLIDNLDELSPAVLILRYEDFPLHWKTVAGYAHFSAALKNTVSILFTPSALSSPFPDPSLRNEVLSEEPKGVGRDFLDESTSSRFASILSGVGKAGPRPHSPHGVSTHSRPVHDSVSQPHASRSRLMAAVRRRETDSR